MICRSVCGEREGDVPVSRVGINSREVREETSHHSPNDRVCCLRRTSLSLRYADLSMVWRCLAVGKRARSSRSGPSRSVFPSNAAAWCIADACSSGFASDGADDVRSDRRSGRVPPLLAAPSAALHRSWGERRYVNEAGELVFPVGCFQLLILCSSVFFFWALRRREGVQEIRLVVEETHAGLGMCCQYACDSPLKARKEINDGKNK